MKRHQRLVEFAGYVLPVKRSTRIAWLGSFALSLALVLWPLIFKLDGHPHAEWEHFLGRFHLVVLHLPIGLLLLIPVLEIAGGHRAALREAAEFVLGLALASCLLTVTLGWLLAHGGGNSGTIVTLHMAGGIALTICTILCCLTRPSWSRNTGPHVYPALLASTLLVLIWTAHQGGTLTHGTNYLTQYMPGGLKRWSGLGAQPPAANSFYAKHIHPIFDSNCVGCHSSGQAKGGLRLDSYELLMNGGHDGPVVFAGQPEKSLLYQRITLPPTHKQFMPAEGKPPLPPEEIALIKAWIQQGASSTAITLNGVSMRDERPELPIEPVGDYSALMPEIQKMQQAQGAKLIPVSSKPEDGLVLYTVDAAGSFGDAQLAQFQKFAPYVVEAELGRTAVTDAGFDTLKQFTHLRALHLEETHVMGDGLVKLTPLSQLTYLNLSGTQVTSATVAPLNSMKNLRHIYLYNTPAQPIARTTQ